SAVAAWLRVCPDHFDILHPYFRRICYVLMDTDEWGQIDILTALLRYSRAMFADPDAQVKAGREEWNDQQEDADS
ncbi:AP-3 complex subunit beta, partial [Kipferlia bialata]